MGARGSDEGQLPDDCGIEGWLMDTRSWRKDRIWRNKSL